MYSTSRFICVHVGERRSSSWIYVDRIEIRFFYLPQNVCRIYWGWPYGRRSSQNNKFLSSCSCTKSEHWCMHWHFAAARCFELTFLKITIKILIFALYFFERAWLRKLPLNMVSDKSHDVSMCLFLISYKIGSLVNMSSVCVVRSVYTRHRNTAKRSKCDGRRCSSDGSSISILTELILSKGYRNSQREYQLRLGELESTAYCHQHLPMQIECDTCDCVSNCHRASLF